MIIQYIGDLYVTIVPFHNDIFPGGELPEHRKLAREL